MREDFALQAGIFFNLLQEAVETGDPSWLDRLLADWAEAQPEGQAQVEDQAPDIPSWNAEEREYSEDASYRGRKSSLPPILGDLLQTTLEVAREGLGQAECLDLIQVVLPVFTHAFEFVTNKEAELQVASVSRDLSQAQKVLEDLDKTKSDFISIAAHELKTPLTLVKGYVSMMEESLPPEVKGNGYTAVFIEGVRQGTQRLQEIIDDMIDVSMIDSHLLSLSYQPVWISRLLAMILEELHDVVTERSLAFTVIPFAGGDEPIYGDAERLYQAFRNVILNSVKFTPDGGKVTVGGRKLPGFLEVTVSDSGIGIDPQDQNRIFEKFGRTGNPSLHSSGKTKFKGGGPGLGLPISKGIIEAHGGAIWVESEGYDEVRCPGTSVHVLLPVDHQPPGAQISKLFPDRNQTDRFTGSFSRERGI